MDSREVTLTVPLSITVRIGDEPSVSTPSEKLTSELAQEAARPRSYYEGYKGRTYAVAGRVNQGAAK